MSLATQTWRSSTLQEALVSDQAWLVTDKALDLLARRDVFPPFCSSGSLLFDI
jgi:hypothetical protein